MKAGFILSLASACAVIAAPAGEPESNVAKGNKGGYPSYPEYPEYPSCDKYEKRGDKHHDECEYDDRSSRMLRKNDKGDYECQCYDEYPKCHEYDSHHGGYYRGDDKDKCEYDDRSAKTLRKNDKDEYECECYEEYPEYPTYPKCDKYEYRGDKHDECEYDDRSSMMLRKGDDGHYECECWEEQYPEYPTYPKCDQYHKRGDKHDDECEWDDRSSMLLRKGDDGHYECECYEPEYPVCYPKYDEGHHYDGGYQHWYNARTGKHHDKDDECEWDDRSGRMMLRGDKGKDDEYECECYQEYPKCHEYDSYHGGYYRTGDKDKCEWDDKKGRSLRTTGDKGDYECECDYEKYE